MAIKKKPTPAGKRPSSPSGPTPFNPGPVAPTPSDRVTTMPYRPAQPAQPAKPGRRVGKNPTPGTPRKVGKYSPVMPTQAKKKK